jgi:hypothetical protein
MANVTLSDGRKLTADMYKLTIAEYRKMRSADQPLEAGDELLGKLYGLTLDEVASMPFPDYRALVATFYESAAETTSEKNSESAST